MRAVLAALLAAALISLSATVPTPAGASQADLDRAKARANSAARELAAAKSRQAELEQQILGLEAHFAQTTAALGALSGIVKERAVQEYIRGGQSAMVLEADLAASTRANTLARFVSLGDDDALDEYRRMAEDLSVVRSQLDAARASQLALVDTMQGRVNAAFAELQKLERLEAERKRREAEQAARARSRAAARSSSRGPTFIAGGGSWMCPVQGPRAFTNDWGQPRSGGRTHKGTDILAPRGTPVVASVSGTVRGHNSRLGGISYYLHGDDGNTYFGTHLQSLSGASGRVSQGTVLGYVGNTGNARGGPTHLHFEIHPGGGRAVNPYPTLRQHC
ncbi:MAG TPA: peptidoglycan DD-metalloendopeptidase family protein [Acidimicrobiales bacterium]|nr:peptidoglycan DD-metalloendopeptidase family protein [Acidimicrobiales bacterium]